jgi:transcriptional regulator with XRE-family HTH domain
MNICSRQPSEFGVVRRGLGISQEALAREAGISQVGVSRVERNVGSPEQTAAVRSALERLGAPRMAEPSLADEAAHLLNLGPDALRAESFAAERRLRSLR